MGARYYSPQLARFISPDPLIVNGVEAVNPYEYGRGSPLRFTDPTGLAPMEQQWSSMSIEEQAAQQAVLGATDPFFMGDDFNPSDPNERPESASDLAGGVAADFEPGGALSDFNGLPGPSLGDFAATGGQELAGAAAGAWNTAVDFSIDSTVAMSPLSPLRGYIHSYADAVLHVSPPASEAGTVGYFIGSGGTMLALPGAEAELAAEGVEGGANIVYRGLAAGEDAAAGLTARAPGIGNSVASHVAGARASQWISTTRSLEIARARFGQYGVVGIDLSKVSGTVVDLTRGIPGLSSSTMLSRWAVNAQEVLILNEIPAEAIFSVPW
jgi:hypothetical protein